MSHDQGMTLLSHLHSALQVRGYSVALCSVHCNSRACIGLHEDAETDVQDSHMKPPTSMGCELTRVMPFRLVVF